MPSDPSDLKVFAAPVLRGGRFDDHSIPVDVLPQFQAYQDLVRALAEALYRKRNNRIRVPPRFAAAFQLKLQKVEGDCAVPVLARPESSEFPEGSWFGAYYDEARDLIATTIQALGGNQPLPDAFPEELLEDLLKLGKYLADDEALELRGPSRAAGPVYSAMTRIILEERLARRSYRKVSELSGTVIGFDWDSAWFRLRTLEGHYVAGRHTASTGHKLLKALNQKNFSRVTVVGEVTFTPEHIPEKIGDLRDVRTWSGSDEASVRQVEDRLEALTRLPKGWMDGEGIPASADLVAWLSSRLTTLMVEHYLPAPALFPMVDGGVQAVWRKHPYRVEAEFNLVKRSASLIAVNVDDEADDADVECDLTSVEGGEKMLTFLKKFLGAEKGGAQP